MIFFKCPCNSVLYIMATTPQKLFWKIALHRLNHVHENVLETFNQQFCNNSALEKKDVLYMENNTICSSNGLYRLEQKPDYIS